MSKQFRSSNYKEFWFHSEPILIKSTYPKPKENMYKITFCGLLDEETQVMSIGISLCNLTTEKNWNRKIGNEIAYGRAMKRPIHRYRILIDDIKEIYKLFINDCKDSLSQPQLLLEKLSKKQLK